jgi:hypothetical protein
MKQTSDNVAPTFGPEKPSHREKRKEDSRKVMSLFLDLSPEKELICVLQISCSFSFVLGLRLGLEQAGNPFCLLINSSWLLVFISLFYLLLMGLNLYWWKGIHFS